MEDSIDNPKNKKHYYKFFIWGALIIFIIFIITTAILSAMNPISSVKYSEDAGTRSDSAELLNAIERYKTAKGIFPWEAGEYETPQPLGNEGQNVATKDRRKLITQGWIDELILEEELKEEFKTRENLISIYIWVDIVKNEPRLCYEPITVSYKSQTYYNKFGQHVGEEDPSSTFDCVPRY